MKIAYFGFDLFYDCLEYLSQKHEIIKIFTCKVDGDYETNTKTFALADKLNIPITDEKITCDMIYQLENLKCDLIISAGYYFKIPISRKIKSINVHPSYLPEGRGPWPFPNVILKGLKETGVSIHELTENFDTGKVLIQQKIVISNEENLDSLTFKSQKLATKLLAQILENFDNFWNTRTCQTQGSYWPEPSVNEMTFTVDSNYNLVDRIVRAFYGYVCYLKKDDQVIKIKQAKCVKSAADIPLNATETVELNDGFLCILKLA